MLFQNRNRRSYIERFTVMLLAALFTVYLVSCSQEQQGPPKPKARPTVSADTMQAAKTQIDIHNAVAVIETAKGEIEVEFFADDAPKTVENFLKNARLEYYNRGEFHRVEPGQLIQAGGAFSHRGHDSDRGKRARAGARNPRYGKRGGGRCRGRRPILYLSRHTYLRQ